MLFSKIKTALITSLITWIFGIVLTTVGGLIYLLSGGEGDISVAIGGAFLMIIYLLPFLLVVGIPISVASDELTRESSRRKRYAYIIHVGLGIMLFSFIFPISKVVTDFGSVISTSPWLLTVIFTASVFWKFDEKAKGKLARSSFLVS
ncbi:hypothetical protein [Guptibacillus hwajinpoensis]|uniref:hypothetical protein n=1 Tax=Guptibacillus hwajinpoensis TaxID=208199 RepID=UPI00384F74E6